MQDNYGDCTQLCDVSDPVETKAMKQSRLLPLRALCAGTKYCGIGQHVHLQTFLDLPFRMWVKAFQHREKVVLNVQSV